jgi:hypothetical protein
MCAFFLAERSDEADKASLEPTALELPYVRIIVYLSVR